MSGTIFFFFFIPLLAFILLSVNLIFAPHNPYMEKNSAFECGFSSFLGQNRTQFSISFFIFALLFLLFDLEILLVYPYLVSAYTNGVYGLAIMLLFLLALTLGFAFELGKKALSIDTRQVSYVHNSEKKDVNHIFSNKASSLAMGMGMGRRSYSTSNATIESVNFLMLFFRLVYSYVFEFAYTLLMSVYINNNIKSHILCYMTSDRIYNLLPKIIFHISLLLCVSFSLHLYLFHISNCTFLLFVLGLIT